MTAPEDRPDELTKAQRLIVAEELVNALTARLAAAEARLEAVKATCDRHEHGALRWAEPLPVPSWIGEVRAALSVAPQPQPATCEHGQTGEHVVGFVELDDGDGRVAISCTGPRRRARS